MNSQSQYLQNKGKKFEEHLFIACTNAVMSQSAAVNNAHKSNKPCMIHVGFDIVKMEGLCSWTTLLEGQKVGVKNTMKHIFGEELVSDGKNYVIMIIHNTKNLQTANDTNPELFYIPVQVTLNRNRKFGLSPHFNKLKDYNQV